VPTINVLDSAMYYEDTGGGTLLVFLHGSPASSYLWRKVLPRIGMPGRKLAPDLIGMGRSGKPDIPYKFADHARYVDAWFDTLGLDEVVLIGHDWGGALGFDWAARHPERVRGVAFMETIVRPMASAELSPASRSRFETFRTPGLGESLALDKNTLVEMAFSRGVLTKLSEEDVEAYYAPYPTSNSRRPLLEWTRAMPLDGEPADVVSRISRYDEWLESSSNVPKLLLTFDSSPTLLIGPELAAWCAANITNLQIEHCGPAGHHAPEDQPQAIAAAIANWADRHHLRSAEAARHEVPASTDR
jgi:haloalkane dehalogenase